MSNFFANLFSKKESTYSRAIDRLASLEAKRSGSIDFEFKGVKSTELVHEKNKWQDVPSKYGKNVKTMGLHLDDDYTSLLLHYGKSGKLDEHYHKKEYQVVVVLDGTLKDIISDTTLKKGEIFITPPLQPHQLVSIGGEAYVYMMMSSDSGRLKIGEDDLKMSKVILGDI